MRFSVTGIVWCDDSSQKEIKEQHDFDVVDPKNPFDELKSHLTKKFYLDRVCRARLSLECRELGVNDWFWYGASYELPSEKINEFKNIVFETSLPSEGFRYLLVEFPWLSNSDLAFNYAIAFPPLSTVSTQAIWGWKRNYLSDHLLNERLLMLLKLDEVR